MLGSKKRSWDKMVDGEDLEVRRAEEVSIL